MRKMLRLPRRFYRFKFLFLISFILSLLINMTPVGWGWQISLAQSPTPPLLQSGQARYQAGEFSQAIAQWQQALAQAKTGLEKATLHTHLGRAYRQVGNLEAAIAQWQKAIELYNLSADPPGQQAVARILTQQAQAYSEQGQHQQAKTLLESATQLAEKSQDTMTGAIAQAALGKAYWGLGDYDRAEAAHLRSLQLATGTATDQSDPLSLATKLPQSDYAATLLKNLGNVYLSRADRFLFQANAACLQKSDKQARELLLNAVNPNADKAAKTLKQSITASQGGMATVQALLNYSQLLTRFPDASSTVNLVTPYQEQARRLLVDLPDSRDKAYALITLAQTWMQTGAQSQDSDTGFITLAESWQLGQALQQPGFNADQLCEQARQDRFQGATIAANPPQRSRAISLLQQAITVANHIGDRRAESFALGALGQAYELNRNYDQAMSLTRQAQLSAQQVSAADSLYRWQWQMGRLLKAQGDTERAIAAYKQAVNSLKAIRGDIVAASRDLQFDFRDAVEPVYRELIELLLDQPGIQASGTDGVATELTSTVSNAKSLTSATSKPQPLNAEMRMTQARSRSEVFQEVLSVLESLKLAELQNFFGDECVELARSNAASSTNTLDPTAAIVYTVLLENRTQLILRLPTNDAEPRLVGYSVPIGRKQMQTEIDLLRNQLRDPQTFRFRGQSKKVYDWLIRPLEATLAAAKPKTLIFINDGVLRQVPMAALYDGEKFLIEQYAIATTPGLQLTSRDPLDQRNLQVLALGLTVERSPFAPLVNVNQELTEIQAILGGTKLLDQDFTGANLQAQVQKSSYSIVHMATHGIFGVDADSTFLLSYDQEIKIQELDRILRSRRRQQPLELLTLSACETAEGDNRSALGIAGVAVRAGVKSAVATLWAINDQTTVELIKTFYEELRQPNTSRAQALQKAQIRLIKSSQLGYSHPNVWSPFILIGNWL